MSEPLTIKAKRRGKPRVLSLIGELTIYAAAAAKERLLEEVAGHDELELDLSEVSELDTAGFQVLMLAKREALANDKILRMSGHSQPVIEVLDLYSMTSYFGDPVVITH